jgi:hypothetical protein
MVAPLVTGSWIDVIHPCPRDGVYWNRKTLAYTDADWARLVTHLKRDLGIDMLFIQGVAKDGLAVYPSAYMKQLDVRTRWYTPNCDDPVRAIMRACSAEGVSFYMGPGFLPADTHSSNVDHSAAARRWYEAISTELLERYGNEPCFAGWYMAAEMSIEHGAFIPTQIEGARFLTDLWKRLTPGKPSMGSPYFNGSDHFLLESDDNARLLDASGLSAIAYQDGIGVATAIQKGFAPDPRACERIFAAARRLHDRTGVELWANCEAFSFENEIFFQPLLPAPFERWRAQLEYSAPYVDRLVSYTIPGLVTSQSVCPGLGAPETETLYQAYRAFRAERLC